MNVTGTREAFLRMLLERGVYKKLEVSRSTANNWKRALLGDDLKNIPTIDRMEELLNKFGAFVQTEKIWQMPDIKTDIMFTEIKNVVVSASSLPTVRFNAETFVSYYDGIYWRNVGIAHLKREKEVLLADIIIFKEIPFESKYPKVSIDNNLLNSILLIDDPEHVDEGIKQLGSNEYKLVIQ